MKSPPVSSLSILSMNTHRLTIPSRLHASLRMLALVATVGAISATAEASILSYLAFGVHPSTNQLVLRDLHDDHYHTYQINNGTDPGGHVAIPLEVTIGSATGATITLISTNNANPADPNRRFPAGADPHLHLMLDSLTPVAGSQLIVRYQHGDHTHGFSVGGEMELHVAETTPQGIYFTLPAGAAEGQYAAVFRIMDESVTNPFGSSTFSVLVNGVAPVPEPSALLMLSAASSLIFRRRRRE